MITPSYSATATERVLPRMALDFTTGVLDPRVTFSRGSNATLVDSTGKLTYAPANLLLYSEQFNNAAWAKIQTGSAVLPVVTANFALAPDGSMTADRVQLNAGPNPTNDYSLLRQTATYPTPFVRSIWLKSNTGVAQQITLVASESSKRVTVPVEWTRVSQLQDVGFSLFDLSVGGNGATPVTADILVWGAQLEPVTYQTTAGPYVATTTAAYYGPRFDYNPATLAARGLLIEEQRVNLLVRSSEFEAANWAAFGVKTVTANTVTSPDGTVNADTLSSVAGNGIAQQNIVISGSTAYTGSVYVKATTGTQVRLQLVSSGGTGASTDQLLTISSGTNAGNGWYRLSINVTSAAADNQLQMRILTDASANPIYIWGAQVEAGAFATSYIPTTTTSLTRNADVVSMTGANFSSWYNASEGTLAVNFVPALTIASNTRAATLTDGTSRVADIYIDVNVWRSFNGTTNVTPGGNTALLNTPVKFVAAYKTGSYAAAMNGGSVGTAASVAVATVTRLSIGTNITNTTFLNGYMRAISYYPQRLTNAEVQAISK